MSKTTEISRKEIEYRELLYSLYFYLMNEIKGENTIYNKEDYKEILQQLCDLSEKYKSVLWVPRRLLVFFF